MIRSRWSPLALCLSTLTCLIQSPQFADAQPSGAPESARPRERSRSSDSAGRKDRDEFRVSSFHAPLHERMGSVRFFFSTDAVSSSTLETTRSAPGLVTLDPAAEGYAEWKSTNELYYYFRYPLRPGTAYTARLSPRLRDTRERRLVGPNEFRFETERLKLKDVSQVGFTPERRAIVELKFSDQVQPEQIKEHLSLTSGGNKIGWELQTATKSEEPRIVTDPITTPSLMLRLEPGMQGVSGPLGLDQVDQRQVPLRFVLAPEEITPQWRQDRPSLVIRFSDVVSMEKIREYIEITPPVQWEATSSYNRVTLTGDFRGETRYQVVVKQGLRGQDGEILLRDVPFSVWIPPMSAFLHLKEAGGHLSPTGRMQLRVRSAGLNKIKASAYRLYDNNLIYFVNQNDNGYGVRSLGKEIASKEFPVVINPGGATLTEVGLRELLPEAPAGVYFISISADRPEGADQNQNYYDDYDDGYNPYRYSSGSYLNDGAVITVSNLGIIGKRSNEALTVWVGALDSAAPLAGATVRAYTAKNQLVKEGLSDAHGLITFTGLGSDSENHPAVVVAEKNGDFTYLNLGSIMSAYDGDSPEGTSDDEEPRELEAFLQKGYEAFVSPERGVYRPGETVHLLGYVRDAKGTAPQPFPLEVQLRRPDGRELEPTPLSFRGDGALVTSAAISQDAPTGYYEATIQLAGTAARRAKAEESWSENSKAPGQREILGTTSFYVEEFMPNRLKVETSAPDKRFAPQEPIAVAVKAAEMFGQPAPNRHVSGRASWSARPFRPKAFPGYAFGDVEEKYRAADTQIDPTTTSEDGTVSVTVEMPDKLPKAVLVGDIQVTVRDVGGRTITSSLSRKVDTAPYYLGARIAAETYPRVGQEATFDVVAVRPDETLIDSAEVTATVSRVIHNSILKRDGSGYRYVTTKELVVQKELGTSITAGRGRLTWTPSSVGSYVLKIADPAISAVTALPFSVSSSEWDEQPWSLEKPEQLELELDRSVYRPGETARLLVKSPFAGTLILSLEQDRVLSATVSHMDRNTTEIAIPITEEHFPNFYCVASVVRPVRPAEKWLPHRAFGRTNVRISSDPRRLAFNISAPEEVRPNSPLTVDLQLQDQATSAGVSGDLIVWAVDEGILSLTAFETPDPLKIFGAVRRLMVTTADFFSELMPDVIEKAVARSAPGGDAGPGKRRLSPVINERVKPVILWHGLARADDQGRAQVRMDVPQFMGQLRVMSVAASGPRFGSSAKTVFVRSPVMVKEGLPRFLAPGDAITVPFSVYNNSDSAQPIRLRLETSGPLLLQTGWSGGSEGGRSDEMETTVVPARGMLAVPVQLAATQEAGQAVVRFQATMGGESFSDVVHLPVRPASPTIRLSGSETVPVGTTKTLTLPERNFLSGTTTGTLVISSKPALRLRNAFKYLYYYRFGCLEQTASSAFPLLFMPELADLVEPGKHSRLANEAKVQWSVDRICSMLQPDGGMVMWPGSSSTWNWGTIYAGHFLVEAKKAGYDVPESCLGPTLSWLQSQLARQIQRNQKLTPDELTERCYTVYVLSLAGKRELDRMEGLYELRKELSPTARALLASAYRLVGSEVEARELLVGWRTLQPRETKRQTGGNLDSPTRETAVVLAALLDTNLGAADVPELVERLEKLQISDGHWGTTQDNAFALWALGKYVRKMGETPSEYRGQIVGGNGRATDLDSSHSVSLTIQSLGTKPAIGLQGRGQAFVEYDLEGVPLTPDFTTVSLGMTVERRYLDSDRNELDLEHLSQGQLVVVEISFTADRSFENIIIEDLLPAGLEIENANLRTSERISEGGEPDAEDSEQAYMEGRLRIKRTEARDDRMIIFADYARSYQPQDLVKKFRYAARVVTPGSFALPPVQASCMYDPEVQARSGGGTVQVFGRNP